MSAVEIRWPATGRQMRCSRTAFEAEYEPAGWVLVEAATAEPKKATKKRQSKAAPADGE